MKKALTVLLAVLLVVTAALTLTACSPCKKGLHDWDEGIITTQPDCETDGVKTVTCQRCGEPKTETVPALGHEYGTLHAETDTTIAYYQCSVCNKYFDANKQQVTGINKTPSGGGDETYTVTFTINSAEGKVTTPTGGTLESSYKSGTTVSFKVVAEEGYTVNEVKVNGTTITATDGVYSFEVTGATTVVVTFTATGTTPGGDEYYAVNFTINSAEGKVTTPSGGKLESTYQSGTTVSFKVVAEEGYTVSEVKVNGTTITATDGVYSFEVTGTTTVVVTFTATGTDPSQPGDDDEVTLTLVVGEIAKANSWEDAKVYKELPTDDDYITVSGTKGTTEPSYYEANGGTWRIYKANSGKNNYGTLVIAAGEGAELISVNIEYTGGRFDKITKSGNTYTVTESEKQEVVFTVENDTVKISKIVIVYKTTKAPCDHAGAEKTDATESTCVAPGWEDYWTCGNCGKMFSDENCTHEISEIPYKQLAAHTWVVDTGNGNQEPKDGWTWNVQDGSGTVKVSLKCSVETCTATHEEELTIVTATHYSVTAQPSCTATGIGTYTVTITYEQGTYNGSHTETIAKLDHKYDLNKYGHSSTEHWIVCDYDCGTVKAESTVTHTYTTLKEQTETQHTYSCVCGETETNSHVYTSYTYKDADNHKSNCDVCNKEYVTTHTYSDTVTKIEGNTNYHVYKCTAKDCTGAKQENHDYNSGTVADTCKCGMFDPTACKHDGENGLKEVEHADATCEHDEVLHHWACGNCGKRFQDEQAQQPLEDSDFESANKATGHSWKLAEQNAWAWADDASSVTLNLKCENCEATNSIAINSGIEKTADVAEQCLVDGHKDYTVTADKDTLLTGHTKHEKDHWADSVTELTDTKVIIITQKGHDYDKTKWVSDGAGKHYYECKNDSTHHDSETECTKFSWHVDGDGCKETCDDCGYVKTTTQPHVKVWVEYEDGHHEVCTNCGTETTGKQAHVYTSYTNNEGATHDGYCDTCKTTVENIPHTFTYSREQAQSTANHTVTCVCTYTDTEEHTFDQKNNTECKCGEQRYVDVEKSGLTGTVTFDASAQGYSDAEVVPSASVKDKKSDTYTAEFTITFNKGSASNSAAYYDGGNAIRVYKGNNFVIASNNATITKIEFVVVSNSYLGPITANVGTYKDLVWTGEANTITFSNTGSNNTQFRVQTITITYSYTGTVQECNHYWKETSRDPATCETAEQIHYQCTRCNNTKTEDGQAATGHSWSVDTSVGVNGWTWTTDGAEPTATLTLKCDKCNVKHTENATISHADTYDDCTSNGTRTYTATVEYEQQTYTDNSHSVSIAPKGHTYDKEDWKYAEGEDGAKGHYHWCSEGHMVEAEPVAHDYTYQDLEDDVNHKAECKICHFTIEEQEHIYLSYDSEDDDYHMAQCSKCEYVLVEEHEFTELDGTKCKQCGTMKHEHVWQEGEGSANWSSNEDGHWRGCTLPNCGAQQTDTWSEHSHNYVDLGDGKHKEWCETCGYVIAESATHTDKVEKNDNDGHKIVCQYCNATINASVPHTYSTDVSDYDMKGATHETLCEECKDVVSHTTKYTQKAAGKHELGCEVDGCKFSATHDTKYTGNGENHTLGCETANCTFSDSHSTKFTPKADDDKRHDMTCETAGCKYTEDDEHNYDSGEEKDTCICGAKKPNYIQKTVTLTADILGLSGSYASSTTTKSDIENAKGIEFAWDKICKQTGMQFQASNGKLWNNTALGVKIVSIQITVDTVTSGNEPYITFGDGKQPSGDKQTISKTATFTPTADSAFFQIAVGSKLAKFSSIKITYMVLDDGTTPAHTCESKCEEPGCGLCTNPSCTEDVCKEKCKGHSTTPSSGGTVTMTSFSAVNGSLIDTATNTTSNVISYASEKGGAGTAPAIYSNAIRLYQGSPGGNITISVKTGYKITSITIGSGQATTIGYGYDGADPIVTNQSLSQNGKFTLNELSVNSVTFHCYGSTSNNRLNVNHISVTYEAV